MLSIPANNNPVACELWIKGTVSQYPWQTDTPIGDGYYRTLQKYNVAKEVIQMLVDIVSKYVNLLINTVQGNEAPQKSPCITSPKIPQRSKSQ